MMTTLHAIQLGGLAAQALTEGCTGKVMGITSRGVFLNTGQRILFVTDADYRSPYNIQLSIHPRQFEQFNPGDHWTYSEGVLLFQQKNTGINVIQATLWQPTPAPQVETDLTEQITRIQTLFFRMREIDCSKGWLYLTKPGELASGSEASLILEMTDRFLVGVEKYDLEGTLQAGKSILGRGGGLTPSGDDWLSGFLLYHARTGDQSAFIRELGQVLTVMAFNSTTMISANRIEAACQGWSEELFLEVVDSLLVPDGELSNLSVERLVNYGHSSGVDTCVGIGAALKGMQ